MLSRTLVLKVSGWKWVERFVRNSFLFRGVVKRFIGGDTLAEGLENSDPLLERGFLISLDLLGESVYTEEEANASKAAYIEMVQAIKTHPRFRPYRLTPDGSGNYDEIETINVSIKLTQCGLDLSDELAERNYRETLEAAKQIGTFVRVDMEASEYTERTIGILERVLPDYPNAGTVLQSYLFRTMVDLDRLNCVRCRLRLVKGAYLEPAEISHTDKAKVDEAYVQLAETMLEYTNYPAFATHDEKIVEQIKAIADRLETPKEKFEFQMLFGIRRDLQDRLLAEGYRVRVYVPFGDSWYPYFSRRLAERPANLWFILKSLFKR